MVFQLSDSLVKYDIQDEAKVFLSIANLLRGYRDGCYYLTASAIVCSFFEKKLKEAELQKILHHIDQTRAMLPSVLWRIHVVLDNPDYSKYEIDLSYFEKVNRVACPFFLSENVNDIVFYDYITRAFHPGATLSYIPAMGGGSTTSKVLRKLRPYGFVLAIVDSDRRYNNANLGETASNCCKEVRANNTFVHLEVLDIHEVENLIPLLSIKQLRLNRESRALLKRILNKGCFSFLPYYDFKEGICVEDLEDASFYQYAKGIYGSLYCRDKSHIKEAFTKQVRVCKKKKLKVIPGFRRDALEKYLDAIEKDSRHNYMIEIQTGDCFVPLRRHIADLVFTFCCARDASPIN